MNNGQLFCNLAFAAPSREESELAALGSDGHSAWWPLSVLGIGEVPMAYLIAKEALRDSVWPCVDGERKYPNSRKRIDLCFVDSSRTALASFELKVFGIEEQDWRQRICSDVEKHLCAPGEGHAPERYNVLVIITEEREPAEQIEAQVRKAILHLLPNPGFFWAKAITLDPGRM